METQKKLSFEEIENAIEYVLEKMYQGDDDTYSDTLQSAQQEELEALLDDLFLARQEKVDGIAQYIQLEKKKIEDLRKEAQRISARARSKENTLNFLTMGWLARMEKSGVKKIEGNVYVLSRRVTKVCQTIEEKDIPEEYWNVTEIKKPDKKTILAKLKAGEEVPGCKIGESVTLSTRPL